MGFANAPPPPQQPRNVESAYSRTPGGMGVRLIFGALCSGFSVDVLQFKLIVPSLHIRHGE